MTGTYSSSGVKVIRYSIVTTSWLMLALMVGLAVFIIGFQSYIQQLAVSLHDGGLAAALGVRDIPAYPAYEGRTYWNPMWLIVLVIIFAVATLACDRHEKEGVSPIPWFLTVVLFLCVFACALTRYQAFWGKLA